MLGLQTCLLADDLTPLLPEIQVRTLVLASSNDEITPLEVQRLMHQRMPRASLEVFDGVGHDMKVEIPDLLAQRTLSFITGGD